MKILKIIWLLIIISGAPAVHAQSLYVSLEIPEIAANPYHKPYVAVWLETPKRQGVHTLAFWKEQPDWFKDLRQWWRKIGRDNSPQYDGATGATRKPGVYKLSWDGKTESGELIEPGKYLLHIEAVREQGSREYLRQSITLGKNQTQQYQLQGKTELGSITITIK